jgi:hypothetical protein
MSVFVLIYQLIFLLIINFKINPYKNSLKIHRIALLIQHMIYLLFLVLINLINFIP